MLRLSDLTCRSELTAFPPVTARAHLMTDVLAWSLPTPSVDHVDRAIPSPTGNLPARLYVPTRGRISVGRHPLFSRRRMGDGQHRDA